MAAAKKKINAYIKLQLSAGKANPSPPVGPALGQHGAKLGDTIIPVVITVYADRTYTFIMKSPPASVLLKKALGLPSSKKPGSGSPEPNKKKIGKLSWDQIRSVAKEKIQDMNTKDLEAATRSIAGTAKNMGIEVG